MFEYLDVALCHLFETLRLRRCRRNINRLMLQARTRMRGQRLKIHICLLGAHRTTARNIMNRSACQTNQYNYLLYLRRAAPFPNKNQKCIFTHPWRCGGRGAQWQRSVWGMREGKVSVPANKHAAAIFCSSKIRYLGQGVRSFLAGLSRESCLQAPSSVWDKWKTFWLSLQGESARRRGKRLWATLRRMWDSCNGESGKKKTLIKQFFLIMRLFGMLFLHLRQATRLSLRLRVILTRHPLDTVA